MKRTFLTVATLVASLSFALVVPTSYAESKPETKASCPHHNHGCKHCDCAKKHNKTCKAHQEKHANKK
ncbi:MAG: hypothetical protein P1U39_05325 [Legionellaceae bacterium]|nr:hypothetical protein [Legionellaceae bacterium]